MTVKNYVLDINKTSLQHPSIVLRQDDYNIYTINISVTENGTPVDLGSYTLNFLGITPAGAKIIDNENFITTPADLAVGKFSYRFPKEAAGSKGVYDVAYFRLKTTSGATSTIDLNLRVLGGIDLTADEVKDYITVDDILLNTLTAEVFKKVDAKVDDHLATVKKGDTGPQGPQGIQGIQGPKGDIGPKGDKGDKGDPGKDAEMPIIGGRNLLLNSKILSWGVGNSPDTTSTKVSYDDATNMWHITSPKGGSTNTGIYFSQTGLVSNVITAGQQWAFSFDIKGTGVYSQFGIEASSPFNKLSGNVPTDWTRVSSTGTATDTKSVIIYFNSMNVALDVYIKLPKLERGNVATDWTSAPEDVPSNDAQLVHKTGNETIAGDKTFTGNTTLATTTILAGNYGLRVTPSGFQKTTDGQTWVSANI